MISVRSPHSLHKALPRSMAKSPYKESHLAHKQCKNIGHSLWPPTMPKNHRENRRQINRMAPRANVIQAYLCIFICMIIYEPLCLYPRHTKYVGVYSFRFSVRLFVRSFVRSFLRSSFHHRVKVFALKFIRPHILKIF